MSADVALLSVSPASVPAASVAHAREVLARHARSFRFAGLFLPPDRLDVAAVVYAFCRAVDDAVDEAPSLADARREASALADELAGRRPPRAVVAAFCATAAREGIALRFAEELVAGVAGDAEPGLRLADDDALLRYCYAVAGTVGGMMCGVLGVRDPAALPHAIDLGIAMQLTNICRDVLEDAHRDRCYLPMTRLTAAGLDPARFVDDVRAGVVDRGRTAVVVRSLLGLAERYYTSAEDGMRFIPWRSRLAILVAARAYRAIGRKVLRRGGDPLAGRVSTTSVEKLGCAVSAASAFVRGAFATSEGRSRSLRDRARGS